MLFEYDEKLCKQDIKSFEQHISCRNELKNKTRMSLPGLHVRSFTKVSKKSNNSINYFYLQGHSAITVKFLPYDLLVRGRHCNI